MINENKYVLVDNNGVYFSENTFKNKTKKKTTMDTMDISRTIDVCKFFEFGNEVNPNR